MTQYLIYIPTVCKTAIIIFILLKLGGKIGEAFLSMLSEDNAKISHKRVIAIATLVSFIHISYMSADCHINLDRNVLWAHVTLILTAAAIASLPQISAFFASLKSMLAGGGGDDNVKKNP